MAVLKKRTFFFAGFVLGLVLFIIGALINNHKLVANIAGIVAGISFFISAASVGALVSGDRVRANFWAETKEGRQERIDMALKTAFLGIPILAAAIGLYILFT